MKKRLFAVLMMLVMLVAAIAITAQAATVPEDVEWIELGSKEDFQAWFNGGANSKHLKENYTAGMTRYYKFTADITLDVNSPVYYLSSNQVNTYIDLNGKTLTYNSPSDPATRLFGSYNADTTHTFVNGTITNNSHISTSNGGLFFMNKGKLVMEDVVINDTTNSPYAQAGKVISAVGYDVTLTNVTITTGTTKVCNYGLAIRCESATLTMTNCHLIDGGSTARVGYGGLVYQVGGTLNIDNCTFTGGYARYGGNVYANKAAVTITDSTFTGGRVTSDGYGGNLLLMANTSATVTDCSFSGGVGSLFGGNLFNQDGPLTITGCTFEGGTAENGGSFYTVNKPVTMDNCTFNGGHATVDGGNILAKNSTFTMTGTTVTGGTADGNGGNIMIANACKAYLKSGTISGGVAKVNGGNIATIHSGASVPSVYLQGANVTGGTANGGGNIFGTNATVTISAGEITDGYAKDLAGNIYVSTACTTNISGGVISGGKADDNGGNFYMSSTNSVLNITGGTIKDGFTYAKGGNIFANNGKITMTAGVISGGYSEASGGNIYANLGYGASAINASVTIKDDGSAETPIPQIIGGVAMEHGGNIYAAFDGSADKLIGKLILGNAIISDGAAKHNGDDLYLKAHTMVEILPEFAQDLSCYLAYTATNSMIADGVYGKAFANSRGISTGDFTGKLVVENYENTFVFAKDGTLYFAGAATVAADGAKTWYKTNEEAVAAYADAAYLQAAPGELVLPEGAYVVDLAGQTVAISGAGAVTLFDSANDDFATFGTATIEGVQLLNTALTRVLNKDYYTMEAEGAYSFHRVEARLTSVALRPSMGGIYYTAKWSCDDTVKPLIEGFGLAVSMKNFPGTDFANDETALYTVFAADAFESGVTKTGAMIANILKDAQGGATQERIAMNSIYAQMDIFAEAYIVINGETYTGLGASYSMYDIMKTVQEQINAYYAQAATMQDFMTQWSGNGLVGEPWDSLDFNVSEDVMNLNTLYAGLQPYYGELHDHANTGGTSDGKQTLSVWKSELERLKMDFATIVDHKQSSHMYLDDWTAEIFIGGSEAQCYITDRTGVKLHYNMIFADPAGLEAVVQEFTEFQWQYYPEDYTGTNAAKLAGGWHFSYPSFTAERFTQLCEAIYRNGGFVAIVHPKSVGYISSDDPADAYFMDGVGMEVFYTIWTTRDGWKTKANHKLWTDMLKAGYRVYATAGNDEHDMPSDKACSVIYSAERGAAAWVEQLRKGQFVAGAVGVRSAMGDTMMGGSTSFEGKRFTFSVGDFHESLYDPTHTYRADVYDQNGVVFSQEVSCTETSYFAFDADNASNYYYIEIYDVTDDSMIAIGNPIWNEK